MIIFVTKPYKNLCCVSLNDIFWPNGQQYLYQNKWNRQVLRIKAQNEEYQRFNELAEALALVLASAASMLAEPKRIMMVAIPWPVRAAPESRRCRRSAA